MSYRIFLVTFLFLLGIPSAQANEGSPVNIQVVTSEGDALKDAQVLIGWAEGDPFAGNVLTTNENGEFTAPAAWTQALPISIRKNGLIMTTYQNALPIAQTLNVNFNDGTDKIQISGTTQGFGEIKRDGKIDFGLVIPAFTRKDLLSFDISTVISPESDIIKVIGREVEVPSNLTLPEQTENYVFPINLNKPDYRLFTREPGQFRFVAAHGQFPVQRVFNDLRAGKSIFEVINHFSFLEAGMKDLNVKEGGTKADMPVNEIGFSGRISIRGPSIPQGKEVVSLALAEKDGFLFPTDVKRLATNQVQNLSMASRKSADFIISLLTNTQTKSKGEQEPPLAPLSPDVIVRDLLQQFFAPKIEDVLTAEDNWAQLSIVLQAGADSSAPQFIAPVQRPVVQAQALQLTPPPAVEGVTPVATLVTFSLVEQYTSNDRVVSERRTRLWENYATGWVDGIRLPRLSLGKERGKRYRWEVLYLGQKGRGTGNGSRIEQITHLSRNSVDLE